VVGFTPRPLYARGNSLRYTLDRRLGGPQSRSGRRGDKNILEPTGTRNSNPSVVQHTFTPKLELMFLKQLIHNWNYTSTFQLSRKIIITSHAQCYSILQDTHARNSFPTKSHLDVPQPKLTPAVSLFDFCQPFIFNPFHPELECLAARLYGALYLGGRVWEQSGHK
jgi:hypothetical protein